jgi:hypothetical protein
MKAIILMLMMSIYTFANIGTIMALKGEATIERGKTIKAKNGMSIEQGDKLVTAAQSRVQVMLKDETVITIGANSSFDFKEFSMDGKNSKVNLKANRGFFRTVTGKIGKVAPKRFKVKTVSATIGIRGTDFSGNIMSDKEVIRCYSGAIVVKVDGGGVKEILSGMLVEITNKNVPIEKKLGNLPRKHMEHKKTPKFTPEHISDVSPEIKKPDESSPIEKYPDHTPEYVPNFHEEYNY